MITLGLAASMALAACGPLPGLEGAWHTLIMARDRCESCTLQFPRNNFACRKIKSAYDAERRAYHAALDVCLSQGSCIKGAP